MPGMLESLTRMLVPTPVTEVRIHPRSGVSRRRWIMLDRRRLRGVGVAIIADCIVVAAALLGESWWSIEALFLCGVVVSAFVGDWIGGLTAWLLSAVLISSPFTRNHMVNNAVTAVTPTAYVLLSLPLALLTSWFSVRSGRTNELLLEAKQE